MTILIKNGTVVDAENTVKADILIKDGYIEKIGAGIKDGADKIIDAKNLTVMPAFVDMHAHLREPGGEPSEDIESGSKAAVAGGFGAVACMPNTSPVLDNVPLIKYVLQRAGEVDLVKVFPIGAISKGQKGIELAEMRLMKGAGAIAFSDDGSPVADSKLMRFALEYAGSHDLLIISHSEDLQLSAGGVVNEGVNATICGLKGITRASEEAGIARDIIIAASVNAPIHIAHVSTRGSVDIIRFFKSKGVKVTAETCPHYFASTDAEMLEYNTNAKINPPLRTPDDVKAIIEGLKDGTIDCIATDHAPHHIDKKAVEFNVAASGTIGFQTAYALSYEILIKSGALTLNKLSKLMSFIPAHILKLKDFGTLKEGQKANITIADNGAEYTFEEKDILSKSKNSLFKGRKMTGRVMYTVIDGNIKYEYNVKK